MNLTRFRGRTVTAALNAARTALGPEALVLGTHLVPRDGWRGMFGAREVEITAAMKPPVSEERPTVQADRHSTLTAVDALRAQLSATGLDAAVVDELTVSVKGRRRALSTQEVRKLLSSWTETIASQDDDEAQIHVFVGPAGAGKTTTIAKIAAQVRVSTGRRIGLISADAFRVGAIEQLRLYSEIIGSPFTAARTPAELAQAIKESDGFVLVDTAGRSPRDGQAAELIALLAETVGVRVHVVMPAGTPVKDCHRILDAHAAFQAQSVVLTKVDECESVAPVAAALRSRGLRVSYLGTGQRVPEDLQRATAETLADALLGHSVVALEQSA